MIRGERGAVGVHLPEARRPGVRGCPPRAKGVIARPGEHCELNRPGSATNECAGGGPCRGACREYVVDKQYPTTFDWSCRGEGII